MRLRWLLAQTDRELANYLARQLEVHPVVGQLLVNRGVRTIEQARTYLDRRLTGLHDPRTMPGIGAAAAILARAVRDNKKICIYGDYDVDGMCATSILLECLRLGGAAPRFYVPDRFEEGYGVNSDSLRTLKKDGIEVIVTVDCGITGVAEAAVCRELGIEYIVTDHHEPEAILPDADAVVHPRLDGSAYPFGQLCGAGVAFKLAWETARELTGAAKVTDAFQRFLVDSTSLAAIATICDVVPMADENRLLVHHGLRSLKRSPPLGLAKLMEIVKLKDKRELETSDIAFFLGPRLNACGRLGQARLGVELLTTRDEQRADQLARHMDKENSDRQILERRILNDAKKIVEEQYDFSKLGRHTAIVVGGEGWHGGVIGIVAGRLAERFHRPVVLVSFSGDVGGGSARSVPGFNVQASLAACSEFLERSGGHSMAAGLKVRKENFAAFREKFHELSERGLEEVERIGEVVVDAEAPLSIFTPRLIEALAVMEPFGMGNPQPRFMATDLTLVGEPKKVGGGERHLQFRVRQGDKVLRAIAFGQAERVKQLADADGKCCLVFRPKINAYNGFVSVDLEVQDFCAGPYPADEPTPNAAGIETRERVAAVSG